MSTQHPQGPTETGTPDRNDTAPLWFGEQNSYGGFPTYPSSYDTSQQTTEHTAPLPAGSPAPALSQTRTEPAQPANRRRLLELAAVATFAALLASGGTYAVTRLDSSDRQTPSAAVSSSSPGRGTSSAPVVQSNPQAPNWTDTAAAVSPSVVAITVKGQSGTAQGSGVLLDKVGNVLTNNHVVDGAQSVSVTFHDGRTVTASIKGTDPSTDLAVVKLATVPSDAKPIAIGDSEALKVGDPVMAVGNPLGLSGTVTTGIVSALNRPVRTGGAAQADPTNPFGQQQTSEQVVTNAIQTSAAINPGNSGGALVNAGGQLVGINSSIAQLGSSSSGSESGNIGIGFAIPVREAKAIADQLIQTGTAKHAYLGVQTTDGTATEGSTTRSGAKIGTIASGTPAAAAGLKSGDVVVAIDGEVVDSADSLVASVRERTAGESVKMTVLRDGKSVDLTAKLAVRPATSQ